MKRTIAVTVAMAALFLAAPSAFAQTAAGAKVTNTATVSYKVGTVTQTAPPAGVASFFVDRKVNLTVSNGSYHANAAPSSLNQAVSYLVTNSTNDVIDIALTATNATGATVYKGADLVATTDDHTNSEDVTMTFKIYANDGATPGTFEGDETELFKSSGQYYLNQMAAGATETVFVVADMPAAGPEATAGAVQDDDILVVNLTGVAHSGYDDQDGNYNVTTEDLDWVVGTSTGTHHVGSASDVLGAVLVDNLGDTDDATKVDNVFADVADDDSAVSNGTPGEAKNGKDASYAAYEIGGAAITVTKRSAVYWDPINAYTNPKAIPGAVVLYCITVANAGSAVADEITISDTMPTNTTFENGGTTVGSDLDTDLSTPLVVEPLYDGNVDLSAANSIRFSNVNQCATTDWSAASSGDTAAHSVEDEAVESPLIPPDATAWGVEFGAVGNYNVTTPNAVTTTAQKLADGTTDVQYTTTMFLVKVD